MVVVIIFLKLTNRSICDNRENNLPYSIYVVAIISVQIIRMSLYLYNPCIFLENIIMIIIIILSNNI